ncbi:hypothetical protein ACR912_28905, partial [Klebsiella pneumoniae]
AQIREILISESAWEEMTCLFAPSLECIQFKWALLAYIMAEALAVWSDIDTLNVCIINYRGGESPYAEGRPVSYRNL